MKNLLFLMAFLASLNSCSTGYVKQEPTWTEMTRPNRPGHDHIWMNGDWIYSRPNRSYSRNDGYWMVPNRGQTYHEGHWKSNRRGYYWKPGRWR